MTAGFFARSVAHDRGLAGFLRPALGVAAASVLLCAPLVAGAWLPQSHKPEQDRHYRIKAEDLAGVTRLRLEAGIPRITKSPFAVTSVLLNDSDADLRVLVWPGQRGEQKNDPTAPGAWPRLTASREGDLLVLRWHETPYGDDQIQTGVGRITLPTRFTQLSVEYAFIEVQTPMPRLQVSASWVEVSGPIGHLDLRSAGCQWPCAQATAGGAARAAPQVCDWNTPWYTTWSHEMLGLKVDASNIASLQVSAVAGELWLTDTGGMERLDLALADSVQLKVDRVALLDPARPVANIGKLAPRPWGLCTPAPVTAPAPGALALEFVPDTRAREKPGQ